MMNLNMKWITHIMANICPRGEVEHAFLPEGVVGRSDAMRRFLTQVEQIA